MLTNIDPAEEEMLKKAGFSEKELQELNTLKATMDNAGSDLERAVLLASMGLNYFLNTSYKMDIVDVRISETETGYQIKAYTEDDRLHALTAVVNMLGGTQEDTPTTIKYGYILSLEDGYEVIKTIEEVRFNQARFVDFVKLTAYGFLMDGKEKRSYEVMAGDPITGIVIHPLPDLMALSGVFPVTKKEA